MFKRLQYKFTNALVNNEIIEKEDFEIYRYGFEVLIYFIVNILVALFIGVIFDRVIHTIIFLSCYCTLRQFTGGYHARNYTECTLTFTVIYIITNFIANSIDIEKYKYLLILVMIICTFIIYKLAPLEHRNKPLNQKEKQNYLMISINITLCINCIFILSIVFNQFKEYVLYSLLSLICIALLLIIGYKTR
ncbi:MAG: accessory gene regulator ArgB-like protein [Peptostreptococcaceae bacterium]